MVYGLSVGFHNVVVRASDGKMSPHVDYNATVNVIPADNIPNIAFTKVPLDGVDLLTCSVMGGSMLPGIMVFEHLVNDQSEEKLPKVFYNATKMKVEFYWPVSNDRHSCIVKVWVSPKQKSPCGRSPWTLSTAIAMHPSTSSRTESCTMTRYIPLAITSTITFTTTETKTKIATPRSHTQKVVPMNHSVGRSVLPTTSLHLGLVTLSWMIGTHLACCDEQYMN